MFECQTSADCFNFENCIVWVLIVCVYKVIFRDACLWMASERVCVPGKQIDGWILVTLLFPRFLKLRILLIVLYENYECTFVLEMERFYYYGQFVERPCTYVLKNRGWECNKA
jgi:hypothetical protein